MSDNQGTRFTASMLDPVHLNQLAKSVGAENMSSVLDLALAATPLIRDELRAACAKGDMQRVARAAHKLKSDSANLGATELTSALTTLESLAEDGLAAESTAAVSSILVLLDKFLDDVRSERHRRGS